MVVLLTRLIQLKTLDIILGICLVSPLTPPQSWSLPILCPINLLNLSFCISPSSCQHPGLSDHYLSPGLWRCSYTLVSWHVLLPLIPFFHLMQPSEVKFAQSCLTLCDPMEYTVPGILQVRILEWVAFPFNTGSSQPRDRAQVSRNAGGFFTRKAQE